MASIYDRVMIGSTEPSKNFATLSWSSGAFMVKLEVKAPFCFINNSVNLTLVGLGGCRL